MAQYNIAANLRAESPVQTILNRQAQRDAHQINQANLRAAEIREPYIGQLLEGQVAQENRAQERWEVEKPFLKGQLESEQEQREQDTTIKGMQIKEAQAEEAYLEAARAKGPDGEPLYDPYELARKYPKYGGAALKQEYENQEVFADQVDRELARIRGMNPEQAEAAYQEIMKDMPSQYRGIFPEKWDAEAMGEYLDYIRGGQKSAQVQLFKEWEKAKAAYDANPTEANKEALAVLERLIERAGLGGSGRGTAGERYAEARFGWADDPLTAAAEYERIEDQITYEQRRLVSERLARDDFSDAFGRVDMYRLRTEYPEEYAQYMQDVYASAVANLKESDRDWYLMAVQETEKRRRRKDAAEPVTPAPAPTPAEEPSVEPAPEPAAEPAPVNRETATPSELRLGDRKRDAEGVLREYRGGPANDESSWVIVDEDSDSLLSPWVQDVGSGLKRGWDKTPFGMLTNSGRD